MNRGQLTINASDASGNPLDEPTIAPFSGSFDSPLADSSAGDFGASADGLGGSGSPVPEPTTLLLALLGVAVISFCARHR
jgi:hypothetical protein